MTYEQNVKAILDCHFGCIREELINNAVKCIMGLKCEQEAKFIVRRDSTIDTLAPYKTRVDIPDNPTNGDILKALFPEATEYGDSTRKGLMFANEDKMCIFSLTTNKDWWDAKYKGVIS